MTRDEGFAVMDVSTSWHEDPKWKAVWRRRPDLVAACQSIYLALVAESWRQGKRITLDDAWPALIPYDPDVAAELLAAKLVDRRRMVPLKAWNGWFEPAQERNRMAKERWRRANQKRHQQAMSNLNDSAVAASVPRGNSADTYATVRPSVPTDPSDRQERVNEAVEEEGSAAERRVDPIRLVRA